jgi:Domain of unknown function DUF29
LRVVGPVPIVTSMTDAAAELYERDFYAWTQLQARELRRFAATRPNVPLDLPNLVEEVRDLGRDYRASVRSWTTRIMQHLLLLEHSPARDPRPGWAGEIAEFRNEITERLTKTLERDLRRQLARLYAGARRTAATKMEAYGEVEAARSLPDACPYTLDQVLGDWWPEGALGPHR